MPGTLGTILAVDDNEALRYAVVKALRSGGYDVMEAGNGLEALELASRLPDLITLDIKLPDIDGYEVCRRLRSNPRTAHIPILHISASFVALEHKVRALEGGADGYLAEPISKDELLATVKALLRMKRAEEESHRREKELRFLANAIPHMVWIADESGNAIYFNDRWFSFTGLSRETSMGGGWAQIIHPDDLQMTRELWAESVRSKRPYETEVRYRHVDGEYRWVNIRGLYMDEGNRGTGRWFGTSTDVQEQKRKEELLQRTEKLAVAGRLAASIAHEINNPLESITNIFYILENNKSLPKELLHFVHTGSSELARVSHIVRQSLSYYRKSEKPAAADLSEVLDETARILSNHFEAHQIKIVRCYRTHRPVSIFASEIRQVFSNIMLNAIEAMKDNGQLTFRVHDGHDWRTSRPGVRVLICDNGPGIPRSDLPRIFEAFFTTKSEKGTGLGLWVSSDIIRKHGGTISLRSSTKAGQSGTVFSIFLPA